MQTVMNTTRRRFWWVGLPSLAAGTTALAQAVPGGGAGAVTTPGQGANIGGGPPSPHRGVSPASSNAPGTVGPNAGTVVPGGASGVAPATAPGLSGRFQLINSPVTSTGVNGTFTISPYAVSPLGTLRNPNGDALRLP